MSVFAESLIPLVANAGVAPSQLRARL
jgi:hypothetical protein